MKIYFWLIRLISFLFLLFISLFALDSITYFWGFLIHLIPSFVFLLLIIISWKYQIISGFSFLIIGLYLFLNHQVVYISLIATLIGILFLLEVYFLKNEKNKKVSRKLLRNRNLLH